MTLLNVIFIFINLGLIITGYFVIISRIEKRLINQDILKKVKEEINSIIIQLNNTTLNNVSLLEERIKKIDKKIQLADRKNSLLSQTIDKSNLDDETDLFNMESRKGYSPKNIIKQMKKVSEKINIEEENIDEGKSEMKENEKAIYLFNQGVNEDEIKKKTGLSSGELELLFNIKNIYE